MTARGLKDYLVLGDFEVPEPGDYVDPREALLAEVFWPGEEGRTELHRTNPERVFAEPRVYRYAALHDRVLALGAVEGRDVRDPAQRIEIIESLRKAGAID